MKTQDEMVTVTELGAERLAIHGGQPVRTKPLALEFPGVHFMGKEEIATVTAVLRGHLGSYVTS